MAKAKTASKAELNRMAELLVIIQRLPEVEQVAILYYMKGKIDAATGNLEIPLEFTKRNLVGRGAV